MPRAVTITIWSGWSTIAKKEKKSSQHTASKKRGFNGVQWDLKTNK